MDYGTLQDRRGRLLSSDETMAGMVIQEDGMADRRVSSGDANGGRSVFACLMDSSELLRL